jgi:phage shock protein E
VRAEIVKQERKNMSAKGTKKATAATSEADELFHEAIRASENALKSGIQLQEESVNLWKELLTKLVSPQGTGVVPMNLSFVKRSTQPRSGTRQLTPHQLVRQKPAPLLLDVREEQDFLRGHIDGAVHVSRQALATRIGELAPELSTPIVIYCAVGDRCAEAIQLLESLGYQNVASLKGGLQAWLEAGGLVESSRIGRSA